ncbi:alpha/beta hydrolase domain-containing protein 17C isoform X3 [Mobula birostris]|uniref:alpha/beta hydrolase domain-containing protein 17C isoform X3 n=1 Tax=Mobula birostris TaxID=1983395 RepID=UPI003B285522
MNGFSLGELCWLFCCPPCPSRIAAKLAFLPPEPTYTVLVDEASSTLHLSERADWQYTQRELDSLEVFFTRTSRGTRIGCMFVRCAPNSRYTLLFSHGNAVDLGQMCSFYIGLGSRINCNIFSYDYSGYGASNGKPSEKNLYADIDAAWTALRTRYGVSPENIILYGQSIGTVPTVDLASRYECAAVILHSPLMSGLRVAFPDTRKTYCFDAFPRFKMQMDGSPKVQSSLKDTCTNCTAEKFSPCTIPQSLHLLHYQKQLFLQSDSPASEATLGLLLPKDHLLEKRRRVFSSPEVAGKLALHLLYFAVFAVAVLGLLHWDGNLQLFQGNSCKDDDQRTQGSPEKLCGSCDVITESSDIYPLYRRFARSTKQRKDKQEKNLLAVYQRMTEVKEILLPCESLVKVTNYVLREALGNTLNFFPLPACDQRLSNQITKINPLNLIRIKIKPQLLYQVLLFLKELDLLMDTHQATSFFIVKKLMINKQEMILGKTSKNNNEHVI